MKRCFAILLALMIVLSLAACGGKDDDNPAAASPPAGSSKPASSAAPNLPPALLEQLEQDKEQPDESKPAESQQSTDGQPSGEEKSTAEKADETAAGFGSYNGQSIVWRVLAVDVINSKALLITKDCLDEIPFHGEETENLTWETSDLRAWLGGEFYDTAFTDEQKGKILEVINPADTNSESGIQGGNDTTDKVFVLSESEMEQYFPDSDDMVSFIGDEELGYWTRTPGSVPTNFVCTNSYGGLFRGGNQATNATVAVRPAIWVDLYSEQTAAPAGDDPVVQKANALAVKFGTYKDSPIKWRVLDVDTAGERALLITEECIDEVQFHAETPEDLTYRTSDLRVWLIGDFHNSSFTAEEKERIIEVTNPQDTNSETGAREPEGYETTDTVFILSATEMRQYFADDEDMASTLGGEGISYWTRTPGNDTTGYVCTYGDTNGGLYMTGNQADSTGVAVRPAIWVDLSDK